MTNIETIYGEKETIVAMEDRKINGRKIENQWQKDRNTMVGRLTIECGSEIQLITNFLVKPAS